MALAPFTFALKNLNNEINIANLSIEQKRQWFRSNKNYIVNMAALICDFYFVKSMGIPYINAQMVSLVQSIHNNDIISMKSIISDVLKSNEYLMATKNSKTLSRLVNLMNIVVLIICDDIDGAAAKMLHYKSQGDYATDQWYRLSNIVQLYCTLRLEHKDTV